MSSDDPDVLVSAATAQSVCWQVWNVCRIFGIHQYWYLMVSIFFLPYSPAPQVEQHLATRCQVALESWTAFLKAFGAYKTASVLDDAEGPSHVAGYKPELKVSRCLFDC